MQVTIGAYTRIDLAHVWLTIADRHTGECCGDSYHAGYSGTWPSFNPHQLRGKTGPKDGEPVWPRLRGLPIVTWSVAREACSNSLVISTSSTSSLSSSSSSSSSSSTAYSTCGHELSQAVDLAFLSKSIHSPLDSEDVVSSFLALRRHGEKKAGNPLIQDHDKPPCVRNQSLFNLPLILTTRPPG